MQRRFGAVETVVPCPQCQQGTLTVHRGCLRAYCLCCKCLRQFSLADLAKQLDADAFAPLADALADRFSDRV